VGDDDAAGRCFFLLDRLNADAIVQRPEVHEPSPVTWSRVPVMLDDFGPGTARPKVLALTSPEC
jgi:hypothetical protein